MLDVAKLMERCRAAGLAVQAHTPFHFVIRGRYEVNLYPTTGKAHLKGGQRSGRVRSIDHVLELAQGEAAVQVGELAKRRQMTTSKRQLWRHSHICGLCKQPIDSFEEATVDHIIPRARGGSNRFDNLQLAHGGCNEDKGCHL